MTARAVEERIGRDVAALGLDPNVAVHSLAVTALTTAGGRGSEIIDSQDFAGLDDPRTTLTDIRPCDRLSTGMIETTDMLSPLHRAQIGTAS